MMPRFIQPPGFTDPGWEDLCDECAARNCTACDGDCCEDCANTTEDDYWDLREGL